VREYESALEEYAAGEMSFARAGLQFSLGNSLRLIGERDNSPDQIRKAIENHASAVQAVLEHAPYWAFRAAHALADDMKSLKAVSSISYEEMLKKYGWIVELSTKHDGHQITLSPFYRVVVPGTSGTLEPDWKSAPRSGDRIRDGSVVWENAGQRSYCLNCKEYLVPKREFS
jgi:hypothetical protein